MITDQASLNKEALGKLYMQNDVGKTLFDYFSKRHRRVKESKVKGLLSDLKTAKKEINRTELIQFFKELQKTGAGRFVTGRKGNESRFQWNPPLFEVGKAAQKAAKGQANFGQQNSSYSESLTHSSNLQDDSILEHQFILRRDFVVALRLPADITQSEATRLSEFLKTIPLS